jgi:hypothetical protein
MNRDDIRRIHNNIFSSDVPRPNVEALHSLTEQRSIGEL